MNALINNGLKVLACGAAAVVITALGSAAFLHDTAVVHTDAGYTTLAPWVAKLSVQPDHAWFGQPEPAVLVD
jgi:hypothetical protein